MSATSASAVVSAVDSVLDVRCDDVMFVCQCLVITAVLALLTFLVYSGLHEDGFSWGTSFFLAIAAFALLAIAMLSHFCHFLGKAACLIF